MVDSVIGPEILTDSHGHEVQVSHTQAFDLTCLYFSAHWCPPCRIVTPKLIKYYQDNWNATGKVCVIFISFDRDEETMMEYLEEMPWLAVPFNQRERSTRIADNFDVCAIPGLVVLTKEGVVLTRDGYQDILSMGEGALVHWLAQAKPKPEPTPQQPAVEHPAPEHPASGGEKPAGEEAKPAEEGDKPPADMPAPEGNTA